MNCEICYHPTRRVFEKNEYWIRDCENCHYRHAEFTPAEDHPVRIYHDDYFLGGAEAGYPDYLAEGKVLSAHGRRYAKLLKKYTAPGTMLDVGAAAGFILKGFTESGWQGIGLEPNDTMASYGRTELGLRIETGNLEQFSTNQQFDLVSMIQVIAHFFDIRKALQNAAEATRPGGFWLIETWNSESWIARLLGPHWHEYSPPSVLHYFSPGSLNRFVSQFGFTEIAKGRPAKRINGAHAKTLLEQKLRQTPLRRALGAVKIIPDNLAIPYPSLDLFWALFQKNAE